MWFGKVGLFEGGWGEGMLRGGGEGVGGAGQELSRTEMRELS